MTGKQSKRRKLSRLAGYDYTQPGAYFVTICSYRHRQRFGKPYLGSIRLSRLGSLIHECWEMVPNHFEWVDLDAFIVMPNHLHGIIHFKEHRRGTIYRAPTEEFGKPVVGSLPTIIRSFKGSVTRRWRRLINDPGFKIWQRNYYEHVIRDEEELNRIRQYIQDNPASWQVDRYYTPP